MKHINIIVFLPLFFFLNIIIYSQQITSYDYKSEKENKTDNGVINSSFTMNYDLSGAGSGEVFKGTMLKTISPNTFWVKNAQIISSDNKILVDLNRKLLVNNISLINQVSANYGYIVEFANAKAGKNIIIAIANSKGEKDSDELIINLDDLK